MEPVKINPFTLAIGIPVDSENVLAIAGEIAMR